MDAILYSSNYNFVLVLHMNIWKKHPQKYFTLAKLEKISVLPWQPNLPKDRKSKRFIWVLIVLGMYNFGWSKKRGYWQEFFIFLYLTLFKWMMMMMAQGPQQCSQDLSLTPPLHRVDQNLNISSKTLFLTLVAHKIVMAMAGINQGSLHNILY